MRIAPVKDKLPAAKVQAISAFGKASPVTRLSTRSKFIPFGTESPQEKQATISNQRVGLGAETEFSIGEINRNHGVEISIFIKLSLICSGMKVAGKRMISFSFW